MTLKECLRVTTPYHLVEVYWLLRETFYLQRYIIEWRQWVLLKLRSIGPSAILHATAVQTILCTVTTLYHKPFFRCYQRSSVGNFVCSTLRSIVPAFQTCYNCLDRKNYIKQVRCVREAGEMPYIWFTDFLSTTVGRHMHLNSGFLLTL
jgi:hypothetical protein